MDPVKVTADGPRRRSRLGAVLSALAVALGVIVAMVPSAAAPASALFGYVPIGGYERGGYEYS
jgi:hypothetical protein